MKCRISVTANTSGQHWEGWGETLELEFGDAPEEIGAGAPIQERVQALLHFGVSQGIILQPTIPYPY